MNEITRFRQCAADIGIVAEMTPHTTGEWVEFYDHAAALAAANAEVERLNCVIADAQLNESANVACVKTLRAERAETHEAFRAHTEQSTAKHAETVDALRSELATARAERDEYKDACEDLMGKYRNADKDCHNCKHRACYGDVAPCVKCLEEYMDGQPVSLWEERDGECFTAHEAEVCALRADAARNADDHEALAGLLQLGHDWHLSHNMAYADDRCWVVYNHRTGRSHRAPTPLAAVQAAEQS